MHMNILFRQTQSKILSPYASLDMFHLAAAVLPPSTRISVPVIYEDSGLAKNATVAAMSSGVPIHFIPECDTINSIIFPGSGG
jgi:hypothetical protein